MARVGTYALALSLAASPTGTAAAEPALPAAIAAPGETVVLTAHAVGTQAYECKAGSDGKLAWTFKEPLASLTADGKVVGRHFAGPTWELTDGSSVAGKAIANAPGAKPGDIPWLKLEVTSRKGGGLLSEVTTVQRINTIGGKLEDSCDRAGDRPRHALRGRLRLPAQALKVRLPRAGIAQSGRRERVAPSVDRK